MSVDTSTERNPASAAAPFAQPRVARLRPKLGFTDVLLQLWRAKWLMLLVFVPTLLAGIAITLTAPAKYTASTRLLVRLGQEYVVDPAAGESAKAAFSPQEELMQAETELARSPVIAERVIGGIGPARLYPNQTESRLRPRDNAGHAIDQKTLEAFADDLGIASAPKSTILRMTYAHEDPALATAALNRFVTEYLKYRQEVMSGKGMAGLAEQISVIEGRLSHADKALRGFLDDNGLSDFDAELAAARKQFADISGEIAKAKASLREAEAKSSGLKRQLSSASKELNSDGSNPTRQALEADQAVQIANTSALRGRSSALSAQKREAEARIAQLASIEPAYLRLKRDRDALEASAGTFAAREQTERARSELAAHSSDNISVYEAVRLTTRGDDTKRLIAIGAAIVGLIAALAVGLWRVWSVAGLATAGSVERTLGLRVLATAQDRTP